MSDTKILQAVLDKVTNVEKKVNDGFKEANVKLVRLEERLDKLGLQIANLEDDSPTIEDLDNLEKRVSVLEQQSSNN